MHAPSPRSARSAHRQDGYRHAVDPHRVPRHAQHHVAEHDQRHRQHQARHRREAETLPHTNSSRPIGSRPRIQNFRPLQAQHRVDEPPRVCTSNSEIANRFQETQPVLPRPLDAGDGTFRRMSRSTAQQRQEQQPPAPIAAWSRRNVRKSFSTSCRVVRLTNGRLHAAGGPARHCRAAAVGHPPSPAGCIPADIARPAPSDGDVGEQPVCSTARAGTPGAARSPRARRSARGDPRRWARPGWRRNDIRFINAPNASLAASPPRQGPALGDGRPEPPRDAGRHGESGQGPQRLPPVWAGSGQQQGQQGTQRPPAGG